MDRQAVILHVHCAGKRPAPSGVTQARRRAPSAASALSYDANGRLATQRYPTGVQLSYQYTGLGLLSAVKLDTPVTVAPLPATPGGTPAAGTTLGAGTLLWQAMAVNAWGRTEQQSYANGINNRAVFDPQSGRLIQLSAGPGSTENVVRQLYSWNSLGQLTARVDAIGDGSGVEVQDNFHYDRLGRLTQYDVDGGSGATPAMRSVLLAYNALGMLLYKSDVGNYSYPAQGLVNGRPHALQSVAGAHNAGYGYDLNGNATSATGGKWRNVAYTSFNLPDGSAGIQGPAGSPQASWQYDENHQRIKETRTNAQGTRITWTLHPDNQGGLGFEREIAPSGAQSNRHYLSAGGATFAVLVTTGALPTLQATDTQPPLLTSVVAVKLAYWHKDQLGSLIATTDHAGAVTDRYAYDPFGKRRYTSSSYDAFGSLVVDWTTDTNKGDDRGYTGHEHLDELGVIHMNGRIFDPLLGRFMQADPHIQDPLNLQNFDRYAYCYNNPLTCTDPTGYFGMSLINFLTTSGGDPVVHYLMGRAAHNPTIFKIGQIAGGAAAAYWCGPFGAAVAAGCTAAGTAAWNGYAGASVQQSARAGAVAGATAYAFGKVGDYGQQYQWNGYERVAAHALVGCGTSALAGGSCRDGAIAAGLSETVTVNKLQLNGYYGTVSAAFWGGVGSALTGGNFWNGARTAAYGYLFNCLSHPGTCTKADQPEIRRAAAACGNDSSCIQRIAIYARESGIPLPPDLAQSLKDFMDISTLPARIFTPAGRVADDVIDAAKFVTGSTSEQIGIGAGAAYEKAMERITRGINGLYAISCGT